MRLCSLSAITTYKYLFTHIGTVFFPLVALTHDGSSSENWIFDGFFFSFSLDLAYTCRASFHSHTIFFRFVNRQFVAHSCNSLILVTLVFVQKQKKRGKRLFISSVAYFESTPLSICIPWIFVCL